MLGRLKKGREQTIRKCFIKSVKEKKTTVSVLKSRVSKDLKYQPSKKRETKH
jgi:hypothetical protein